MDALTGDVFEKQENVTGDVTKHKSHLGVLQRRQRVLGQQLAQRLQELRTLCLREAQLTGQLPKEFPLADGERPPQVRRRVGATFPLNDLTTLPNQTVDDSRQGQLQEILLARQIVRATQRLASEPGLAKNIRRQREDELQEAYKHLRKLEHQARKQCVTRRSTGSLLDNPSFMKGFSTCNGLPKEHNSHSAPREKECQNNLHANFSSLSIGRQNERRGKHNPKCSLLDSQSNRYPVVPTCAAPSQAYLPPNNSGSDVWTFSKFALKESGRVVGPSSQCASHWTDGTSYPTCSDLSGSESGRSSVCPDSCSTTSSHSSTDWWLPEVLGCNEQPGHRSSGYSSDSHRSEVQSALTKPRHPAFTLTPRLFPRRRQWHESDFDSVDSMPPRLGAVPSGSVPDLTGSNVRVDCAGKQNNVAPSGFEWPDQNPKGGVMKHIVQSPRRPITFQQFGDNDTNFDVHNDGTSQKKVTVLPFYQNTRNLCSPNFELRKESLTQPERCRSESVDMAAQEQGLVMVKLRQWFENQQSGKPQQLEDGVSSLDVPSCFYTGPQTQAAHRHFALHNNDLQASSRRRPIVMHSLDEYETLDLSSFLLAKSASPEEDCHTALTSPPELHHMAWSGVVDPEAGTLV
uniref:FERM domain-containing protein 4B-like n=1 Tax=Myxine glutinosa TaxID=7769 RepID=UPI00358F9E70